MSLNSLIKLISLRQSQARAAAVRGISFYQEDEEQGLEDKAETSCSHLVIELLKRTRPSSSDAHDTAQGDPLRLRLGESGKRTAKATHGS